jgi:hypothetical protein
MKKSTSTKLVQPKRPPPRSARGAAAVEHALTSDVKVVELGLSGMLAEDLTGSPDDEELVANGGHFVRMMREPQEALGLGHDFRLVEVDRTTYFGPSHAILPEIHQLFWYSQLNSMRQVHPDILTAAPGIWSSLGIGVSAEWSAWALHLDICDKDISEAFQAALFQTYNTSAGRCDLSTIICAIAAFIHAHPAFKDRTFRRDHEPAFGDSTAWALFKKQK